MSVIFGIVYLDGRPVDAESLGRMRARLSYRGPDGDGEWIRGPVGLGHGLRRTTPEVGGETMPCRDEQRRTVMVATARLDNREELCTDLGLGPEERATMADVALVHLAWRRWGRECVRHLLGDWALAVWDEAERSLFIARDQLGNTGLVFCFKPPMFAFASGVEGLLALSEVSRQPDEIFMARYLVHLPGEFERTAWQDVSRLLPGHCLALTEAGPRVKRYCCLEDAPRVRLRSRRDYEEGFLSLFRQAVRVRLRGVGAVGTMMSGGLDSGSVTALAAEVMRGRGERLTAFTSVPAYPAQHLVRHGTSDEWVRAHTVARHWDNIDHVAVKAEKESPLAAVEKLLAVYPQPVHAASNQYWMQAILREARQRGIGVLLNGQMGNGGVSWNGGRNGIFHLFAQGHWTAGRRALAGWRSGRKNKTAWYAWRSQVLSPLVGPWVHRLRGASLSRRGMGDNRTLFTVDFERRAGLAGLWERETRESGCFWPEDPLAERLRIFENNTIVAGAIAEAQSAATGVDVRDPTADLRLVEYCLGVPDDCYLDERGSRVLIRGAMAGLVPDEVRWNTAYGTQAADFLPRLRAHGAELEIILDRFAATPAVSGRLNVEVLRAAWNGLPRGDNPDSARDVRAFILRGVMAGMFLETSALTDS